MIRVSARKRIQEIHAEVIGTRLRIENLMILRGFDNSPNSILTITLKELLNIEKLCNEALHTRQRKEARK